MSVADKGRVVPPDERAVERRADARVGLRADDDESPDPEARQHDLEGGVLEGVAVVLLDERLGVARSQLGDDPPVVAPPHELLVGVLDPDDGDPLPPRPLDEAADGGDDRVALVSPRDDPVLHVDDEECGVRPVLECGHSLSLVTLCSRIPLGCNVPTPPPRATSSSSVTSFAVRRGSPCFAPGTLGYPRIW